MIETGTTRVFGRGDNPANFVSVHAVARFIELAVLDPAMRGRIVEIGGPENLTMRQVASVFETLTVNGGRVKNVPLPMMRLISVLMRPLNPTLARQAQAGVVMDTTDTSLDSAGIRAQYPTIPVTTLAEAVKRDYGASSGASS